MENYSSKIIKIDGQRVVLKLNETLNIERLKTFYDGYDGDRQAELKILDPRQFTPQQRRFIYALMGDIYQYTGQPVADLKEYFYLKYEALTNKSISLKDTSDNSVDDATLLANIVLDFILENNIPMGKGYEILPQNIAYYLYKCCATRTCCICGDHAQIHHYEAIGMGANRQHYNHLNHTFMALCPKHHQEIHQIGKNTFCKRYKVKSIKLNEQVLNRLNIRVERE